MALTINQVKVYPSESIQGASVDFCLDISERDPSGQVDVNYPDGRITTYYMDTPDQSCFDSLIGQDELYLKFEDTSQMGVYDLDFTVWKGSDYDYASSYLNITPMSVVVEAVDYVKQVSEVKRITEQPELDVFGTEYTFGDNVTTFAQLVTSNGTSINDATCYATIWYPDKSVWFETTLMTYQTGSNGIYYIDLVAPTTMGVYMVDVMCNYYTQDFYFNADGVTIINGTYISGTNSSVSYSDDNRYVIRETGNILSGNYEPILYWRLDETSGVSASEEIDNLETWYNGSMDLDNSGTLNTGAYFDGVDDYMWFTDASGYTFNSTEQFGICFGINASSNIQNTERVFDFLGASGFSVEGDGNRIKFFIRRSVSGDDDIKSDSVINDNLWHRICFFDQFATDYIYIDTVLDRQENDATSGSMTLPSDSTIGVDDTFTKWFSGGLDEICIFRGTNINKSEVVSRYQNGSCESVYDYEAHYFDMNVRVPNVTSYGTLGLFSVLTEYQWSDSTELIDVMIYNFTSDAWVNLTNHLVYSVGDTSISSIVADNYTDFLDIDDSILLRYKDDVIYENNINTFKIDRIAVVGTEWVDVPITEIRGGGEIHVTEHFNWIENALNWIMGMLTSIYNTVFEINQTVTNISITQDIYHNETLVAINNTQANLSQSQSDISQQIADLRENMTKEFELLRRDHMEIIT